LRQSAESVKGLPFETDGREAHPMIDEIAATHGVARTGGN
jgi:hypothetical protein